MLPAFYSTKHLIATIFLLAGLLLLPILLYWAGSPPRSEVYKSVAIGNGNYTYYDREFFREKQDIDWLFLGASRTAYALDRAMLNQALTNKRHAPARVVITGSYWFGMDMEYMLLRDVLANRRVHTVFISIPEHEIHWPRVHARIFRVLRWGDYPDMLEGLGLRDSAGLYAAMVLGAPRQALNLLRPNAVTDAAYALPFNQDSGYNGSPFIRDTRKPPAIPANEMIYSTESPTETMRFQSEPIHPYQRFFLHKMAVLLHQHNVRVVFIHVNEDTEYGSSTVTEGHDWRDIFGADTPIIGVPLAALFPGMPKEDAFRFYIDHHFNRNGREYFTTAILPALLEFEPAKGTGGTR